MKAETAQSQAKAENKTLQNLVQQFYQLNASEVQTVDKKRFDTLGIPHVMRKIPHREYENVRHITIHLTMRHGPCHN